MSRADQDDASDEKPRGVRPWDSVRASKVRRARKLLTDPGYPSKKTLDAVAEVLARSLAAKRSGRTPRP